MYNTSGDLLDALKATPDTLAALLKGVSQKQAQAAKGGDENWSVVEVVCHLRDAEEISLQRLEAMRDQDNPAIIGYDQEALARQRNYKAADLQTALADFISLRKRYVAALAALRPQDWQRTGQHNEMGQITIEAHTAHHACHDAIHCAQIARQLDTK